VTHDALVDEYLGRLEAAAQRMTPDRRRELTGEVREHISAALEQEGRSDPSTVRNVLERLGPPEEIVAAEIGPAWAAAGGGTIGVDATRGRSWGALEIAAILLLVPGAVFLPFIGPILGIILVWMSAVWSTRVKLIATLVVVVLIVLPVALLLSLRAG
jgi:uncharacterized membrane protein